MSINSVNVKLPQLETTQLQYLHQGDVFMFPNKHNLYQPSLQVYMVLARKDQFEKLRPCVCLNHGDLKHFSEFSEVIRLKVTMECSYCRADDDDGLPF